MRIKEIVSQSRRDMRCIYECEHCLETMKGYGYDDSYFHNKVIPAMKCEKCGKKAGEDYRAYTTKYPDYKQL